jgi:hypothetical protein
MPVAPIAAGPVAGLGGGCYNIFSLIILILVVLQFGRRRGFLGRRGECGEGILAGTEDREDGLVDNGILFIITIFLLIWCTCGRGGFTSGCGGFGGVGGYPGVY